MKTKCRVRWSDVVSWLLRTTIVALGMTCAWRLVMPVGCAAWRMIMGWTLVWLIIEFDKWMEGKHEAS